MNNLNEFERYPKTGRFLAGRARSQLSEAERSRMEALVAETEVLEHGHRVIARGQTSKHSTMLIEGFMLRTLESENRRHAVSFHVPGDFVDLHCFALQRLDHNIDCVGVAKVGYVPHDAIVQVMRDDPELARLFWFSTLLDAAMHRRWIMKLEQLTAPCRIAHIFAEIWERLEMVGLARTDGFDTPLTQIDLADMCGATAIHVNRAIAELRKTGIADFRRGRVMVSDRERLKEYGDFNPGYLYADAPSVVDIAGPPA
ncbi:transcriptional regulator [Erythrobacter sp. QSSC1-22B]|uniref:Crp/Fnr family transcriptional regulator n=1 Tax=Erythrobacter sp. QSSC1-22B TaxID=1860125 RepID=UPI0008049C5D|nr:Crp/Fnr family transcriptional regulator [Erythrobacter sp. QSSC1-22B]OBX19521.1 transcriptional regulator [Erythrobacter sp. QSSC1-22B]